jgi:drug/metabolite transporter (DMT)-like permease
VASVLGFLWKYKGAVGAPAVEWRSPVKSSLALLRSPWYALGMAVAMGSWGLHVTALALAPISLVQSIIAGGLILVTLLADRMFGLTVTRREWIGVGLMAAGLAFLAATLEGTADSAHADWHAWSLALYVGAATVAGTLLVVLARRRRSEALFLAASAGALWAASDISIKALSGRLDDLGAGVLLHPLALVILLLSLYGLLVSGRSLQLGDAVAVIAVTSAVANMLTILSGPVIFGEPLPGRPLALAVRVAAFVLVVVATALTPPPAEAPSAA